MGRFKIAGFFLIVLALGIVRHTDCKNYFEINSSFETGLKMFSVNYNGIYSQRQNYCKPWEIDCQTAAHGKCSLKIIAENPGRYYISSRVYTLQPGKKYTLSLYAKASCPVTMPFMLTSTEGGHPVGVGGNVRLSTEWKRYSCSGILTTGEKYHSYKNRYFLAITYHKSPETTIWIDGIQIEQGDLTPYQPAKEAEINVTHPRTGHIFYVGETPKPAAIKVYRVQPDSTYTVSAKILNNYTGEVVTNKSYQVKPGTNNIEIPFAIPGLPRGSYMIRAHLLQNEKEVDMGECIYAFIKRYNPKTAITPENSYIGVHGGPGLYRTDYGWNTERDFWYNYVTPEWTFQLLKDLGIHWQRIDSLSPHYTCKNEYGEIYGRHIEEMARFAKKYDVYVMPTLGHGHERGPDWMTSKEKSTATGHPLYNLAGFGTYVKKLAEAAPTIRYWESFNEPNCYFSPEEFYELNKVTYEALKSVNPDNFVIGFSCTGDLGADRYSYLMNLISLGTARYVDAISIHGFYGPSPLIWEKLVDLGKKYGKPVWETELGGSATSSLYSNLLTMQVASQRYGFRWYQHPKEYAIMTLKRYMTGYAAGVQRCFVHAWWLGVGKICLGEMPCWFEYDLSPRPIIPATDAFNELIDGGTPHGLLDLGGENRCYLAVKNGNPIAFLQAEKEHQVEIPLPASQVQVLNLMGNPVKIKKTSQRMIQVAVGHEPIYIVGKKEISLDRFRNAILKIDLNSEFFSASAPRLGMHKGKPTLIVKIQNTGAIAGLSGTMQVTESSSGLQTKKPLQEFQNIPLRDDRMMHFPFTRFEPAEINPAEVIVSAKGQKERLRNDIKVLRVKKISKPLKIDGNSADWDTSLPYAHVEKMDNVNLVIQGTPWENPKDCSARLWSCWDENNLYFLAEVKDEKVMMDPKIKEKIKDTAVWIFESDCLELFFDTDLMKDFYSQRVNADEFQFLFSTQLPDGTPGYTSIPEGNTGLARQYYQWKPEDKIEAASSLTEDGYIIEICIPFKVFGKTPLYEKKMIGFDFAVDDDDTEGYSLQAYTSKRHVGRDIQMKWSGRGLANPPTQFGILLFEQ